MQTDSPQPVEPMHRSGNLPQDAATSSCPGLPEITYYTDPLCPWSWAVEAQWRRLRFEFEGRIAWRYVMGGMIADWKSYHDPLNAVHNPGQMALQCFQARQLTGIPLTEHVWRDDPPASSYPACLAVKAAELQGVRTGESYLRRVREAVMLRGLNVARAEVLLQLAEELAADPSEVDPLDPSRFHDDILGSCVAGALQDDLQEVAYRRIERFPTLTLSADRASRIVLAGYRPYAVIRRAMSRLFPDVQPREGDVDVVAYLRCWRRATGHEIADAFGIDRCAAVSWLEDAVQAGVISHEASLPGGYRIQES